MGLNKCIFIGRVVRDLELEKTSSDISFTNFSIAVDKRFKPKNEDQPTADFIPVVAWRGTAEFATKYFCKGKQIFVCGSLETYTWDKSDGKKGYGFRINADELGFADSIKGENGGNNSSGNTKAGNNSDDFDDFPAETDFMNQGDFDDDLPF